MRKMTLVKYTILVAVAFLAIVQGCVNGKAKQDPAAGKPVFARKAFQPPADSSITLVQMQRWLRCNPFLDSLSYLYQDSFQTEDPARRFSYQKDFVEIQDKICVRNGLTGGYDEYLWILDNAGSGKNRRLLETLGLKAF